MSLGILKDYIIKGEYDIKFIKNEKFRITPACLIANGICSWRIHAWVLLGQ